MYEVNEIIHTKKKYSQISHLTKQKKKEKKI